MINLRHMLEEWVRPVLHSLELIDPGQHTHAAEQLLLGTALVESHATHMVQFRRGPARSFWQLEPDTHDDIWEHWLPRYPALGDKLRSMQPPIYFNSPERLLTCCPVYACAMARQIYRRRPEPLPAAGDGDAQGRYWKQHYNTVLGAGDPEKYADLFGKHVAPMYSGDT